MKLHAVIGPHHSTREQVLQKRITKLERENAWLRAVIAHQADELAVLQLQQSELEDAAETLQRYGPEDD